MMNKNVLINAVKVAMYGKPFYAEDLGLNGGNISGLQYNRLIKPTGKTKKVWVEIYPDIAKRCEIQEWVADYDKIDKIKENLAREIADLTNQLELLNTI